MRIHLLAQPLYEEASGGSYYSLLNQGSGLARVDLAAQADSFIRVSGQEDYKVKAELGDDPRRDGVNTFDFTITNLEDTEQAYTLEQVTGMAPNMTSIGYEESFYIDSVLWAVEKGITKGLDDGTFGVSGDCTRAQVVTFQYRALVK